MDPLGYAMGQLAAQSVRRQFEYEAEAEVAAARRARLVHPARATKKLGSLAKRLAAGGGSVPATERR
jgi:hypothetical protein